MILNKEIIGLYTLSSILEIAILVITFFDQTFLSIFLVIKLAVLVLNVFFMSIFHFSSSRIRIKKSKEKKKYFLIEQKKYFFLMIFLITESMVFIIEYIYLHKISNPYISLFKSGIFGSKLMIARGSFIRLKKGIILIVLSLFLGLEMMIFSDVAQFSSGEALIIVLSYLLIIFNLFCHQIGKRKASKIEKMKTLSHALFEEMFSNNEKSIFIIKNSIKSIKLEMINQKAASIFDLEIIRNIDYETLTRSFQAKFSGFSFYSNGSCNDENQTIIRFTRENKNSTESQKFPNTDQELMDTIKKEDETFKTKRKVSIYDLIEDFSREQKVKKVEILLKNHQEHLNYYRFEIIKVKHNEKNYFIFFIHDQSKIAEIENLKNINEFNNRLLCSLSHEIKTPINGALPNLEILKSNIDDDDLLELLEISIGSLKILENSLDNIMAFNLLQVDQIFLSKNKFALNDLISEISNILYPMIIIKKLNFSIQAENLEKIQLTTDYIKLKQILLNLLTNAIQFTLEGDIVLKIELTERIIKFSIQDTGIGMDFLKWSNLIKKLKEPNQENLKINSSGSCMGLLISEKLSILLGSEDGLEIQSTLNKGSEFTFSIIAHDRDVDTSEEENTSKLCTTKKITSSKSKSKSSVSIRTSLLKLSSFIEDKKQLHLIEHKSKKSAFALEDTENQGLNSIKSVSNFTNKLSTQEYARNKYNFESLVKLFDHLDDPRKEKEQLNHPLCTDPNIKKIIFNNYNHHSVSYGNTEKDGKTSSNTYAHIKHYLKRKDLMIGESDSISLTLKGQTIKKTLCDCEEILYVDDDAFNLLSLELILKPFNLKCCKVMNGLEALKVLEKRKCDSNKCKGFKLIFMDYQMPIMDGIETTKNIMEMISKNLINEVPIIGCTAFVSKDEILKCYEVGMKDVIFKPLNINLVENILIEWL